MWADAYAKILEQGDLAHIALLLIVGLLTVGMVAVWRAWRADSKQYLLSVEDFSAAVAKMRETLVVLKDRSDRGV
jgi:hypothetical protein